MENIIYKNVGYPQLKYEWIGNTYRIYVKIPFCQDF